MLKRLGELYKSYGGGGMLRLARDYAATRVTLPQARLLRRPFYLRGKRWMQIGPGFTSGPGLRMDAFPVDPAAGAVLRIGRDVQVNDSVHIGAVHSVSIGDRVLIASRVFIADHNHGCYGGQSIHDSPLIPPAARPLSFAPLVIEEDVWLGEGVCVLPGVRIGKGAVIGAASVVTRDVAPYTLAVGAPARAMRRYDFETARWEEI